MAIDGTTGRAGRAGGGPGLPALRLRPALWAVAAAALVLAWGQAVLAPRVRPQVDNDTQCYAEGADAVRQGVNPYTHGERCYLYHPALATALALLPEAPPLQRARAGWAVNAAAAAALVVAVAAAAGLAGSAWGLLPLLLLGTQTVLGAVGTGNVAIVLALLLVLALLVLDRAPWLAGLLLGLAIVLKTMPGLYVPFLLAAGWRRRDRGALVAGSVAAVVGLLSLATPWTAEFVQASAGMVDLHAREVRNFAWVSWLHHALGVEPPSPWPFLLAGAGAAAGLGARRRGGGGAEGGTAAIGDPGRRPTLARRAPEWALVGVLANVASPIAWTMSFSQAFLPLALLLARAVEGRPVTALPGRPRLSATLHAALLVLTAACVAWPGAFWSAGAPGWALVPMTVPLVASVLLVWQDRAAR